MYVFRFFKDSVALSEKIFLMFVDRCFAVSRHLISQKLLVPPGSVGWLQAGAASCFGFYI